VDLADRVVFGRVPPGFDVGLFGPFFLLGVGGCSARGGVYGDAILTD
jgi:hypothetical protein